MKYKDLRKVSNIEMLIFLDTCTCSTPSAGTAEHNEIKCSNGETTYCKGNEECYATGEFNYGQWTSACRVPAVISGKMRN